MAGLQKILPDVYFEPGDAFFWSPAHTRITYKPNKTLKNSWSLLHEASHALLGHTDYQLDLELLLLETTAWQEAQDLAVQFSLRIPENHIQDCLDTYRDWLHQRSTCPRCSTVSLQISTNQYQCHNCSNLWQVSSSRFCRPYRLTSKQIKRSPESLPQATFR